MAWAEHLGQRVEYTALPHEAGGGYSYNLNLSTDPADVVHIDTTAGTVLTDEQIVRRAAYWRLVRERRAAHRG